MNAPKSELPAVVRRIGLEHQNMAVLLDLLERNLEAFERDGTVDYDLLESVIEYFRRFPDACHHPKEDMIFARLQERNAAAAAAVGDLPGEHADLKKMTDAVAATISDILMEAEVPRDQLVQQVRGFLDAQRRHMRMEQERFFPAALAALTPEDWSAIAGRIDDPEDPVFGSGQEEAFEALRAEIIEWDRAG